MQTYFIDNNSDELILFFLGWGMDERPMLPFTSTKDILYFYDYVDLDYSFDFSKYSKFYLIGYSAGVSVGAYLKLPKIEYSIAINGSLDLCNKDCGLSDEVINVFKNITIKNYMEFRRNYLVTNEEELEFFNKHQPYRTVESSLAELASLKKYPFKNNNFKYDKVIVSKEDKILPLDRQLKGWGKNCIVINGAHYPFFKFKTLDELFLIN